MKQRHLQPLFELLIGSRQQMELAAGENHQFQDIPGKPFDITTVPTLRQHQGRPPRK